MAFVKGFDSEMILLTRDSLVKVAWLNIFRFTNGSRGLNVDHFRFVSKQSLKIFVHLLSETAHCQAQHFYTKDARTWGPHP